MKPTSRSRALTVALALALAAGGALAQAREPLCVTTEARRLASGARLADAGERLVAQPLLGAAGDGARFVVAVRDPSRALGSPDARAVASLGYGPANAAPAAARGAPGLAVVRVAGDLRPLGEPLFIDDPVDAGDAPAIPVGVALPAGVLVLQRLAGDLYATVVPPAGPVPAPRRVAAAPAREEGESGPAGFAWITAVARGDGAVALAGTEQGRVVALRFDRAGAVAGAPATWARLVGGPMQLVPVVDGPVAALLARPVAGTGPNGEQARMQALVTLDDGLAPRGAPFATGFAQFPIAAAARPRALVVLQWSLQQGVAIATLPVQPDRIGEQLPRLWYARPPLEGAPQGHAALTASGQIVYDVAAYGEPAGGLHVHVAWLPPSGVPVIRRDVLPTRTALVAAPQVLPAADGVTVVLAGNDETGGAVDAYHVRCDLVAARGER